MTAELVVQRLSRRLLGSPLLRNSIRGEVVEEIVAMALEPEWELCAGDWASCDLRHRRSGVRIQVKQSAARQSWHKGDGLPPKPRFSIAEKTGRWEEGDRWVEERSRNAELFVFAWHPVRDSTADHRDPEQWLFYVVPEPCLPPRKSISLAGVQALAPEVDFSELAAMVEAAHAPRGRSA